MATGELGEWASQLASQYFGAVAWEGLGALTGGGNDAVRRRAERGQIQPVEADGRGIVSQEELKVPDPSSELAAYVRRQAATEGFDQMERVLRRAVHRGDIDGDVISARITRLPIDVLYSELCLGDRPVSDRLVTEIVDDVFLPLTRP